MQMDEPGMQMLDGVADMVSIQPEATVSRTAMRTEGGNVVLFAFDDEREVAPGDLVYLPTRLPHAVKALEPSVMMLTMITAARAADAIDG